MIWRARKIPVIYLVNAIPYRAFAPAKRSQKQELFPSSATTISRLIFLRIWKHFFPYHKNNMKYSEYAAHQESTGLLFWQVSTLWQRAVKDALRQYGLTHTQYVILAVIEELQEKDDNITQKNISDFSMVDTMTVSSSLRLLEKKGLTNKTPQTRDTRANRISNTEAGTYLLREAVHAVECVDKQFFFKSSKELAVLQNLLINLKEKNINAAEPGQY